LYRLPLAGKAAAWTLAVELVAGLLLVLGRHRRAALTLTGLLLVAYWWATVFGPEDLLRCGCFGTVGPRPTFAQHVALLVAMTLAWAAQLRPLGPERPLVQGRWLAAAIAAVVVTASLGGLSLSAQTQAAMQEFQPFQAIPVVTLDGARATVDATSTPVIFIAWWCPHCHALLKYLAGANLPRRPVLISTFFRSRDMAEERNRTLASLEDAGILPEAGWTVYLDASPRYLAPSVPMLAYMDAGRWRREVATPEGVRAAMEKLGPPGRR
ncbi:MAG: hypothetical protein ACM3ZA_00370, partial [Bacillota bacterium]